MTAVVSQHGHESLLVAMGTVLELELFVGTPVAASTVEQQITPNLQMVRPLTRKWLRKPGFDAP